MSLFTLYLYALYVGFSWGCHPLGRPHHMPTRLSLTSRPYHHKPTSTHRYKPFIQHLVDFVFHLSSQKTCINVTYPLQNDCSSVALRPLARPRARLHARLAFVHDARLAPFTTTTRGPYILLHLKSLSSSTTYHHP